MSRPLLTPHESVALDRLDAAAETFVDCLERPPNEITAVLYARAALRNAAVDWIRAKREVNRPPHATSSPGATSGGKEKK